MTRTGLPRGVPAAACGIGLLLALAGPAGAQADPPGNNGTVKIDAVAFDDHPNNEPHVGCEFQVDFYGFDEGDLDASVLLEAIPPTVPDGTVPPGGGHELLGDVVPIGEDPADGGTDLDASATYDLTSALAGIDPHPVQGWHVRLTVHAEGSQGADTKHKVFWVSGCEVPEETTTTTEPEDETTTTTGPEEETTTTTAPGPDDTTTSTAPPAGVTPTEPPSTVPAAAEGDLPVTGSSTVPLLVGALGLIALGTGGVVGARHFRGVRS